jgi:hypothetical protein
MICGQKSYTAAAWYAEYAQDQKLTQTGIDLSFPGTGENLDLVPASLLQTLIRALIIIPAKIFIIIFVFPENKLKVVVPAFFGSDHAASQIM